MRHLMASPSVFLLLRSGNDWWDKVNNSVLWQDRIFHTLAVLYDLMSAVALIISSSLIFDCISGSRIQLIRIECRASEFGWTTQKVFHLLNFLVNGGSYFVFLASIIVTCSHDTLISCCCFVTPALQLGH
ncbi:hypothetical protein ZIOFF_055588 [Zingiber officinale]|uniref:THH1/TOM1/TOM3 domain-containing protein n=1 Tax=Zingiber officinale TaxID=94328 RepID=A0A8J5KEQ7_ZINOF|nr:hypothetical protein ZIOFF_055588 [Zingiber officinale]